MTHYSNLPNIPIPDENDHSGFNRRDQYEEFLAMEKDQLVRLAWNLWGNYCDREWEALNLAQDISCEFELMDIKYVKPEFAKGEAERRQRAGLEFVDRAYELAGFTPRRRSKIASIARAFSTSRADGNVGG